MRREGVKMEVLKTKDILEILQEAKKIVETEISDLEEKRDSVSPIEFLEKSSFRKGKLHVIDGLLDAFK